MSTPGRSYPKRSRQSAGGATTHSTSRRARRTGGRTSAGGSGGGVVSTDTLGVAAQKWTKVHRPPMAPTDEPYFGSAATAKFAIPTWVRVEDLTAEERATYLLEEEKRDEQRAIWRRELAAKAAAEAAATKEEGGGEEETNDTEGGTSGGEDAADDVTNSTAGGDGAERRGTMETADTAEAEANIGGTEHSSLAASDHPAEEVQEPKGTHAPADGGGEEGSAPKVDAADAAPASSEPTPAADVATPVTSLTDGSGNNEAPSAEDVMEIEDLGRESAQADAQQPATEKEESKGGLESTDHAPPAAEETLAAGDAAPTSTSAGDEKEESGEAATAEEMEAEGQEGGAQAETADEPTNAEVAGHATMD
ncbi:hypothetical protein ACHAXT_006075 [Thalassiosira profunda]